MNNELKFLIYRTPEEEVSINAVVKDETIWLTQKAMAELFDVGVPAISKHLKNIFEQGELEENMVVSILEITTEHGAIEGKVAFGKDYFKVLLERVRSIRTSERRIWLQITDIFAECIFDYDKNIEVIELC